MDDIQVKLTGLIDTVPNCTDNRQVLKSALMDYIPEEKKSINLLLIAYDEGIVDKLRNCKDTVLCALQIVKDLSANYGITRDSALLATTTWCHILNKINVAEALNLMSFASSQSKKIYSEKRSKVIGIGTYKAGFDFEPGDIQLKHLTKDLQAPGMIDGVKVLRNYTIDCYTNTNASIKGAKKLCSFTDSCHLEVAEGVYLIIKTGDFADATLIKIELVEYN